MVKENIRIYLKNLYRKKGMILMNQIARFYSIIQYIDELEDTMHINLRLLSKFELFIYRIKNRNNEYIYWEKDLQKYIDNANKYIDHMFYNLNYNIEFLYGLAEWMIWCDSNEKIYFINKPMGGLFTVDVDETNISKCSLELTMKSNNDIITIIIMVINDNITVKRIENGVTEEVSTAYEMSNTQLELITPVRNVIKKYMHDYMNWKIKKK